MLRKASFPISAIRFLALAVDGMSFAQTPALAGMVLSFGNIEYTSNNGDYVNLQVFPTQVAGGPQVDASNPLLTAGIRSTFNTRVVAADIFTHNPIFESASETSAHGERGVTLRSLNGAADFSNPVLVGVYRFLAASPGGATIVLQDFDSQTPDFITLNGDIVDPTNQFTARSTVVPEPASFLSMTIGGAIALAWYCHGRKSARTG